MPKLLKTFKTINTAYPAISNQDRVAYSNYIDFCSAVAVPPMSYFLWEALTRYSVEREVDRFYCWLTKRYRDPSIDADCGAVLGPLKDGSDADLDESDAWQAGLRNFGELRSDGTVRPVRSQTPPIRGRREKSPLVGRLCKTCQVFLFADRFSKNGKPAKRGVCKSCDNKRRVIRRREQVLKKGNSNATNDYFKTATAS